MASRIKTLIDLLHAPGDIALATHSTAVAGFPYATEVAFATDEHHRPVLLIPRLAEPPQNLLADSRANLLVARYLRFHPETERFLQLCNFRFFRIDLLKVLILIAVFCCEFVQAAAPLPQLAAIRESLTVSGLSSGAYMAVQFQVAHSQLVRGAGIIAGGPYYCAEGQAVRALSNCMSPTPEAQPPSVAQQESQVNQLAKIGRIDNPENLRTQRVWMFSGGGDRTVQRSVMDALAGFYRTHMPETSIRYVKHPDAGHAMPSVDASQSNACETSEPPFINRCQQLDAAGALLNHLLGPLKAKSAKPDGQMLRFDQRPFLSGKPVDASMADEGYAYIPKDCLAGGCRIHIVFHGCRQSADAIGTRFVTDAGYNSWADANRVIVLYPQTVSRYGLALGSWKYVINPKGCWDWWGYTGANYHTKEGAQIKAVVAMIEQLSKSVQK